MIRKLNKRIQISSNKKEFFIYLIIWGAIFITPLLAITTHKNEPNIDDYWSEAFYVWRVDLVYLVVFLIHDLFLCPLFIYQKHWRLYILSLLCLIFLFSLCRHSIDPNHLCVYNNNEDAIYVKEKNPQINHSKNVKNTYIVLKHKAKDDYLLNHHRSEINKINDKMNVFSVSIALMMLATNLGIKSYFKSEKYATRIEKLEIKGIEDQINYLRYQINPHFFMNSLNNIHALVDIDPEKAKTTIVSMSKIMRYVLYEGDKPMIPLQREVGFLEEYFALMSLRYSSKIKIKKDFPKIIPDASIPPLLLATFIENAFTHGVSYDQDSFIDVKLEFTQTRLLFECRNSKQPKVKTDKKSIGLQNIFKRIKLVYGNDYKWNTIEDENTYEVKLNIPLRRNIS